MRAPLLSKEHTDDQPISPLRQRMLDDMAFRNMSPATQRCYTYAVACFARYYRASPDKLGIEHVRENRLHLLSPGLKARSINPIVGVLRFFNGTTLGNKALADQIGCHRPEDTLPAVLPQDQVLALKPQAAASFSACVSRSSSTERL
jgi:integrase/recombinase XerD